MYYSYVPKNFTPKTTVVIEQANDIIAEYQADGYDLTLRQLYYQFVARDMLPNSQQSYNRLGGIINDARLAGLVDWEAIEDRTRNLEALTYWTDPAEIVHASARSYRLDKWEMQPCYVEVWYEKEALAGIFERVCYKQEVPSFACRGYVSQSEMWRAGQRFRAYRDQECYILHFGDHDPSGVDMTRDITDRLELFEASVEVERLALNMNQVRQYKPPPNPAKMSDGRAAKYVAQYGSESWELDALDPRVLEKLVEDRVAELIDWDQWEADYDKQEDERKLLQRLADNWNKLSEVL